MLTPSRTPHRPFIPTIDTSAPRQIKDEYNAFSGWQTPLSAQEHRRPSLSYSALSEPSPSSLPSTPGYHTAHSSFSNVYAPHGIGAPVRAMTYYKPDTESSRPLQDPFTMLIGEEKYQTPIEPKYQQHMVMSPITDSLTNSFTSNTPSGSWEHISHPAPQLSSSFVFRPSNSQRMDCIQGIDPLSRSYVEPMMQPQVMSTCPVTAAFDNMQAQAYLSPQQLVVSSDAAEQDYVYVPSMNSSFASSVDHGQMHSASFDTLSPLSPWSHSPSSPIHGYELPGDELMAGGSVMLHDDQAMSAMLSQSDYDQSPLTPRRGRIHNGKPGSAKKSNRHQHTLTHNSFYGVDVAIDSKSLKVDGNGRITKKNDGVETKRFKCTYPNCHSRSARKEHLRRHELSHMPDKQFRCMLPKCNRAITRSDNLIQHLMTHARPQKPGKRNNHYSQKRIEQMVMDTEKDAKLAERTIINLRKAIEREQDKWPHGMDADDMDWASSDTKAGASAEARLEHFKYED